MSGSRVSITPGSLVKLRSRYKSRYVMTLGLSANVEDLGVVIKSLGTDPNAHECFEVLLNDKMTTAWDDELEKQADSP